MNPNTNGLTSEQTVTVAIIIVGLFMAIFLSFRFVKRMDSIQRYLEKKYNVKLIKGMNLTGYLPDGGAPTTLKIKGNVSKSKKRWISFLFGFYTFSLVFLPLLVWILLMALFYDQWQFMRHI